MNESRKNLLKGKKFTAETAREMGARGGKAADITNKKNKSFKEAIEIAIGLSANKRVAAKMREAFSLHKDVELTNQDAMVFAQILQSIKGSTQAFNTVVERLDGKVAQVIDQTIEDKREVSPEVLELMKDKDLLRDE